MMHHPLNHTVLQPPSHRYSYPFLAGTPTPNTEAPLPPSTQVPHTRTHILRYIQPSQHCDTLLLLSANPYNPSLVLHPPPTHPPTHVFFLTDFACYDRSWKKIKRLATRWPQPRKWFGAYVCIHRAHLIVLFLTSVVALHLVPLCTSTPVAFILAVDKLLA